MSVVGRDTTPLSQSDISPTTQGQTNTRAIVLPYEIGGMPQRGRGVVLGVLLMLSSAAQAYDFLEIYSLARASDPVLEAARQTMLAAGYRVDQANAGWQPTIGINGTNQKSHGDYQFGSTPPNPPTINQRQSTNWNWALQLTQPVWKPVQTQIVTQAQKLKIQYEAQYEQAKQELFSRVATGYFAVETAQQAVLAAQTAVDAGAVQYAIYAKGYEAGTHSLSEREDARAKWELAKSQRLGAQTDLDTQLAELEKITGSLRNDQNPNPRLSSMQPRAHLSAIVPNNMQEWIEQARGESPLVLAKLAAVKASETEIAKSQAGHQPTLDVIASRSRSYASGSNTPSDYESRTWVGNVGMQLNIPLFAGNLNVAKTREAIAQMKVAQAELESAERGAESAVIAAFKAVGNHLGQIEALNAAIESARVALAGNQAGLRFGLKIRLDVLLAEQQLAMAKRDWIKARYDALLQSIKLKVAAGQMSEDDVVDMNHLFSPEESKAALPKLKATLELKL
jgi:outer membrane protein